VTAGAGLSLKGAWIEIAASVNALLNLDQAIVDQIDQIDLMIQNGHESISLYLAEWFRIAFAQFLSSESRSLMGIMDPAEFRLYAIDRFRGIIFAAVKTSRKTNSPIPTWAETMVVEAWTATQ
jgi:hypothetical protein